MMGALRAVQNSLSMIKHNYTSGTPVMAWMAITHLELLLWHYLFVKVGKQVRNIHQQQCITL
jgi:hypothetical protein